SLRSTTTPLVTCAAQTRDGILLANAAKASVPSIARGLDGVLHGSSRVHRVGAVEGQQGVLPYRVVASFVADRLGDHAQAVPHLLRRARRFAVELEGEVGEVAHQEVEDLI